MLVGGNRASNQRLHVVGGQSLEGSAPPVRTLQLSQSQPLRTAAERGGKVGVRSTCWGKIGSVLDLISLVCCGIP